MRITEWRLSPTEIQADLDRNVTIMRTKDSIVGAPTGNTEDAVLVTLVQGKLQADSQVAAVASKIEVDAKSGEVTLKGSAASPELVGRAIALALNTEGVMKVSSDLKIEKAAQ
ncbi:MAG: BON domain-containing protein [Opitutaceae bacterium]